MSNLPQHVLKHSSFLVIASQRSWLTIVGVLILVALFEEIGIYPVLRKFGNFGVLYSLFTTVCWSFLISYVISEFTKINSPVLINNFLMIFLYILRNQNINWVIWTDLMKSLPGALSVFICIRSDSVTKNKSIAKRTWRNRLMTMGYPLKRALG